MQKIPSLYVREPTNPRVVSDVMDPDCLWVWLDLEPENVLATVKHDGTCCAFIGGHLYRHHVHKPDKGDAPPGWRHWSWGGPSGVIQSGHGWLPVQASNPQDRYHVEARDSLQEVTIGFPADGSYELVGPKVQSNPYKLDRHELWRHGMIVLDIPRPEQMRDFKSVLRVFLGDDRPDIEGVVWHHVDGRMAKVKRRDLGLPWPPR